MTPIEILLLFVSGMIGGILNSVAGGGSFLTLPTLTLSSHVPSLPANATSTVALWPGSIAAAGAYRKEFDAQRHVLMEMGAASLIGGVLGALLLARTRPATFDMIFPYLMLTATLLFTFGGMVTKRLRARSHKEGAVKAPGMAGRVSVICLQLIIAVYGGFFGGGIGILMLAMLSLMGMEDIHIMNALKTVLATLINGVAVVIFMIMKIVYWPQALVMMAGAILGGYFGAFFAKRLPPAQVRQFVIVIAFSMTAVFFYRAYFKG